MTIRTKGALAVGALIAALAVGGAGAAGAFSAGDDEAGEKEDGKALTGATADRAGKAALEAAGGGEVLETEADDEGEPGGGAYEVAVKRPDGSTVEVQLDRAFKATSVGQDD
jgi:uncharacterized membrane protein YkoI